MRDKLRNVFKYIYIKSVVPVLESNDYKHIAYKDVVISKQSAIAFILTVFMIRMNKRVFEIMEK